MVFWILRKEDEMLKRMIEDEIEYEKTTAEKLEENAEEEYLLKYSNGYFHCQKKNSSSKFKYLRKEDSGLLRKIAAQRYRAENRIFRYWNQFFQNSPTMMMKLY